MGTYLRPTTRLKQGILWMLLGTLFNAITSGLVKYTLQWTSVEMTVFARSSIGFFWMLPYMFLIGDGRPFHHRIRSTDKKMHLVRGLSALASLYLLYYSLQKLDLADAVLLSNTMPIFIPIVLFLWKGVEIKHKLWWGIGLSFFGVLVLIHPGAGIFQIDSTIALLSALAGAIATTALRYAHFKETSHLTLFYYFLITFVISGLATLFWYERNWVYFDVDTLKWLIAIGVSGLGWQVCFTLATKNAPIRITSPLLYLAVLFSILIDWWIWGRVITLFEALGFCCVIAGACLVVYLYPKEKKENAPR